MTTAVVAPPVTASLGPSSEIASTRTYAPIAPSTSSSQSGTPAQNMRPSLHTSPSMGEGSASRPAAEDKSPSAHREAPKIVVKKEPGSSPEMQTTRHRPRKLDLSTNVSRTSGPLTARPAGRDSATIQDVGLACLSPGFQTQNPSMREQLQKSLDVREKQRQLIEARQRAGGKSLADEPVSARPTGDANPFSSAITKSPHTSRRKGPPPGLSIAPPSHAQFANERVIQSAPLNQTFTGLRPQNPYTRHQPPVLAQDSHIHHVPVQQTSNRLPPISDVFAGESLGGPRDPTRSAHPSYYGNNSPGTSSHSNNQPPFPSPGFPHHAPSQPPPPPTSAGRPREYKSAEEAVQSLAGGREDLLPRIVHYGGHQPPTPPSPMPPKHPASATRAQVEDLRVGAPSTSLAAGPSGRRRGREEYERDMGSPPLRPEERRRPFGEGRDSADEVSRKKDEFLSLCSRAWDLFHS